jgi:hypothetical protein
LTLLLTGCPLLASEKPVLFSGSGDAPDLSGEYEFEIESTEFYCIITRSDKGKNSFDVTLGFINGKGMDKDAKEYSFALAEKLNDNYGIIQLKIPEKKCWILFPVQIHQDGIIVFLAPARKQTSILARYKLTLLKGDTLQGDMPQKEYSKAVKAAYLDLITEKVLTPDVGIFLEKK